MRRQKLAQHCQCQTKNLLRPPFKTFLKLFPRDPSVILIHLSSVTGSSAALKETRVHFQTHCLFPFWVSAPSAFPLPPPWEPWHCPGPPYLARGRATEKGRVYFLFLWIIYQYNSPLCCLATAEWRVSFIIRTERGCGKRALDSSGSVWILLSGESLNGGGVFFFVFFFQQWYE